MTIPQALCPALTGLAIFAIVFSVPVAPAQDLIVDSFDTAASVTTGNSPGLDWVNYRGYNVTVAWDDTQNSTEDTNSGSMYVTVDWPRPSDPGYTTAWTDMQFGFSTAGTFNSSNYIEPVPKGRVLAMPLPSLIHDGATIK